MKSTREQYDGHICPKTMFIFDLRNLDDGWTVIKVGERQERLVQRCVLRHVECGSRRTQVVTIQRAFATGTAPARSSSCPFPSGFGGGGGGQWSKEVPLPS